MIFRHEWNCHKQEREHLFISAKHVCQAGRKKTMRPITNENRRAFIPLLHYMLIWDTLMCIWTFTSRFEMCHKCTKAIVIKNLKKFLRLMLLWGLGYVYGTFWTVAQLFICKENIINRCSLKTNFQYTYKP